MGCNCKNDINIDKSNEPKISLGEAIGKYSLKGFTFLLMLALLPLINLAIIWFMFNTLVLSKEVNIKPLLLSLGNQFKQKEEDEDYIDDEEFNELTEDDVVIMGVDNITNKSK